MRLLLVVFVTACWSSQTSTPVTPAPTPEPIATAGTYRPRPVNHCNRTVERLAEKFRADAANSGIPEATIDEMIETVVESCRSMEWSAELLACLDEIDDQADLTRCQSSLSQEQSDDLTKRMMDVVSRMSQSTSPPPPP